LEVVLRRRWLLSMEGFERSGRRHQRRDAMGGERDRTLSSRKGWRWSCIELYDGGRSEPTK